MLGAPQIPWGAKKFFLTIFFLLLLPILLQYYTFKILQKKYDYVKKTEALWCPGKKKIKRRRRKTVQRQCDVMNGDDHK